MGAWGEGPYDNDTAADWFYDISKKPITSLITNGLESKDYDEIRAAAYLLERVGETHWVYPEEYREPHVNLALEKLKDILQDDEWTSNWRDVKAIKKSVKDQIKALEKLL